jgi:hypothetical protein
VGLNLGGAHSGVVSTKRNRVSGFGQSDLSFEL